MKAKVNQIVVQPSYTIGLSLFVLFFSILATICTVRSCEYGNTNVATAPYQRDTALYNMVLETRNTQIETMKLQMETKEDQHIVRELAEQNKLDIKDIRFDISKLKDSKPNN